MTKKAFDKIAAGLNQALGYVKGSNELAEWKQAARVEAGLRREFYHKAKAYHAALERIAIVCTDNMDRDCNHRMALDFVRQIANDATPNEVERDLTKMEAGE